MGNSKKNLSLSKSARFYTGLIVLVMTFFAVTLTTYMTHRLEKRTEEELTRQVGLLIASMSSYHAALAESAVKMADVFSSHFTEKFSVDNNRTVTISGRQTPLLKNGSATLNLNNTTVDRFTSVTKAVGTVFARSGEDFIRVTTSLKKEDGSRAIGTVLERNHPAYNGLLRGIGYVGKAELFGKDYMTSYQPIRDGNGRVIAVLFIGLDFTDNLKTLKEKIRSIKIAQSGYIFVLDAKEGRDYGKLQIHPAIEGSIQLDKRDSDGIPFVREILRKKEGVIRYHWINKELGETKVREKLVAYGTLKEWNWIICAGSWMDELNGESMLLLKAILGTTAIVAIILVLLFRNMIRMERRLTAELQRQVDGYHDSQEELQATEEMLRGQIEEYQRVHDQLLATEEMLRVQLEAVEENEQKFRAVFENSPITVVLTDVPDGRFQEVNQAYVDMFGYKRDEVIGNTTVSLGLWLRDEDRNRYLQLLRGTGRVDNFETEMRRKDGEIITLLFFGTQLEIAGKPFVLSAVMDITEQKRLQYQLHQAQKMDAIGQLAGGIAHDFNNMLTAILGSAEMLHIRLAGDDKNLKKVATIIDAARRSADLARDLLTFSSKHKNSAAPVNVHDIINAVIALLERSIDRKIELQTNLSARNQTVLGDQTQLQSTFLNLGINARDAMPNGGRLIFATSEILLSDKECLSQGISLKPGNYIEISVSDTGIGMTEEIMGHIFEPFYTTKGIGKGTGLGLAAVYGTVAAFGGEIRVQSQPGLGSVFKIYLPLVAASINIQADGDEIIRGSGGILLVDDEEILRGVGRDLLEDLGYTVYLASNGQEALELFDSQRSKISLVILDMIMPRMGGKETFLKLLELDPHIPVLFCSGFHLEGTEDELRLLGAAGFIQKPYNLGEFSRIVAGGIKSS